MTTKTAAQLIDQVRAEHPFVVLDTWVDADGDETVTFTPANVDGVSVTVVVRTDGTVQVEAVSYFEDLYLIPAGERIDTAARITLSFAEHGYHRIKLRGGVLRVLLGLDDGGFVQGPANGYWGVDEYAEQWGNEIVEVVEPWRGTRTSNSD